MPVGPDAPPPSAEQIRQWKRTLAQIEVEVEWIQYRKECLQEQLDLETAKSRNCENAIADLRAKIRVATGGNNGGGQNDIASAVSTLSEVLPTASST
jgi:predicted  nucleic acid-binding Zn-ribbon protein